MSSHRRRRTTHPPPRRSMDTHRHHQLSQLLRLRSMSTSTPQQLPSSILLHPTSPRPIQLQATRHTMSPLKVLRSRRLRPRHITRRAAQVYTRRATRLARACTLGPTLPVRAYIHRITSNRHRGPWRLTTRLVALIISHRLTQRRRPRPRSLTSLQAARTTSRPHQST